MNSAVCTTGKLSFLAVLAVLISACGGSPGMADGGSLTIIGDEATGRTFKISDDDNDTAADDDRGTYQDSTLTAMFLARNGDCIEFEEGSFRFTTSLVMSHKEGICIKGAGQDKTILDFADSTGSDGFSLSHMKGITVEDLTIIDTPGFSIRVSDSDYVTLQNMRTMWSSYNGGMSIEAPSTLDVQCNGLPIDEYDTATVAAATATGDPTSANGSFTDENGLPQSYVTHFSNGGYAIYPVLSNNIYLDNVTAYGASDAGIYVGQSNDVVVENSLASFNVAGYEIENTDRAVMRNNRALCNTAGFLIFDLPGLNQYGEKTRAHHNVSRFNNWTSFAPNGSIVGAVPKGTGFLQLGYDQVEIFENFIYDNSTLGYVFVSLELMDEGLDDHRMDLYPEGIWIHDNIFRRNGLAPQMPEETAINCSVPTQEITLPNGESRVICPAPDPQNPINDGHDSLLPALVSIKQTVYKTQNPADPYLPLGADIVWDGYQDDGIENCEPEEDDALSNKPERDAMGKPDYDGSMYPSCRSNSYKYQPVEDGDVETEDEQWTTFEGQQYKRMHPRWWTCINNNQFTEDFPEDGALIRPYLNFVDLEATTQPKTDLSVHDCEALFGEDVHTKFTDADPDEGGKRMPPLDEFTVAEFVPGQTGGAVLDEEAVLAICENYSGNTINRAALEQNCPKLSHFNLFANKTDPRSGFNEGGYLFDLSTPLFSDYASKYRVVWAPPGEKLGWVEGTKNSPSDTLYFPPGSVIAKTFTFKDEVAGTEDIVETRLLIHRTNSDGDTFWEGMAYYWEKDENGNYVDANLSLSGESVAVSWNYSDPHPEIDETYVGNTDSYSVPHPNQCGECHQNDDRPAGDAPIGPKVRLLNIALPDGATNQLQDMINKGILEPRAESYGGALNVVGGIATNALRLPNYLIPVDSGATDSEFINIPDTSSDNGDGQQAEDSLEYRVEMRARAYLETNCAHCHNAKGIAKQTGFWLDTFRRVAQPYGICKTTTTATSASDGRDYDIDPGDALNSILHYRIGTTEAGQLMPPVARSVNHTQAIAVLEDWINNVLDENYPNGSCGGDGGGGGLEPPNVP